MKTEFIKKKSEDLLEIAVEYIHKGFVIAIPTETVYGLVCDISNEAAIKEIYRIKTRSFNKPLTAFCGNVSQIEILCKDIPTNFYKLSDKFMPGPITVVLRKRVCIPDILTSGKNTLGVRIPAAEYVLALLDKFGNPLASTSANISNTYSLTSAKEVYEAFADKIPLIVDGGNTKIGIASTVVDLTSAKPKVLREGALSKESIFDVLR